MDRDVVLRELAVLDGYETGRLNADSVAVERVLADRRGIERYVLRVDSDFVAGNRRAARGYVAGRLDAGRVVVDRNVLERDVGGVDANLSAIGDRAALHADRRLNEFSFAAFFVADGNVIAFWRVAGDNRINDGLFGLGFNGDGIDRDVVSVEGRVFEFDVVGVDTGSVLVEGGVLRDDVVRADADAVVGEGRAVDVDVFGVDADHVAGDFAAVDRNVVRVDADLEVRDAGVVEIHDAFGIDTGALAGADDLTVGVLNRGVAGVGEDTGLIGFDRYAVEGDAGANHFLSDFRSYDEYGLGAVRVDGYAVSGENRHGVFDRDRLRRGNDVAVGVDFAL